MNSESPKPSAISRWTGPNADIAQLWALRLFTAGLIEIESGSTLSLRLFGELGDSKSPGQSLMHIRAHLKATEKSRPVITGHLAANLKLLGKHFGLTKLEQDILAFRVTYRFCHLLGVTLDQGSSDTLWTDWLLQKILATALSRSEVQIEEAMRSTARLGSSGLLLNFHGMSGNFGAKLSIMPGLATALSRPAKSIDDLLSHALTPVNQPTLSLEHYPHHFDDIQLIEAHLQWAIRTRAKGINILLHGDPGVGKTELANLLIRRLGLKGYRVTALENAPAPNEVDVHPRFRSFMFLQALLGKTKNGVVLFDEFEDVIPNPGLLGGNGPLKSWLNKTLEETSVPTIWISNHVAHLDMAYLRRFDMVLKIRNPPRSVRKQMLTSKLENLQFDEGWIDVQAEDSSVSPAVLDRVVRVIRNVKDMDATKLQTHFARQLEERRAATDLPLAGKYHAPKSYRMDLINTSVDLTSVTQGIKQQQRGKALLFGPPGSGKTAFAHHLARMMDRPLLLKRASDLVSMWVGETEKNLRQMFVEAADEEAVLLLDEADSFLQDRRGLQRSWELSQVNELLTQMETFHGVFICATNFHEQLDAAVMRRFAFKIKFDYLDPNQCMRLFEDTLVSLGGVTIESSTRTGIQRSLARLGNLTPGDFAAAADQFRVLGQKPSVEKLQHELILASSMKQDHAAKAMGFM